MDEGDEKDGAEREDDGGVGPEDEEAWQRAIAKEMGIEYVSPEDRVKREKEAAEKEKREEQEEQVRREEEAKRTLYSSVPMPSKVEMTVEEGRALFKVSLDLCRSFPFSRIRKLADRRSACLDSVSVPTLRKEHLAPRPLGLFPSPLHQRPSIHPSFFPQRSQRSLRRVLPRQGPRAAGSQSSR
jgi:hypothetical protein